MTFILFLISIAILYRLLEKREHAIKPPVQSEGTLPRSRAASSGRS